MGDLFFFVKIMVLTFVVVILMQVKIGNYTVEDHAMNFVAESSLVMPIQKVADGGVVLIRQTFRTIAKQFKRDFAEEFKSSNAPGSRTLGIKLERSQAVLKKQAEAAANDFDQSARSAASRAKEAAQTLRREWETSKGTSSNSGSATQGGDDYYSTDEEW